MLLQTRITLDNEINGLLAVLEGFDCTFRI